MILAIASGKGGTGKTTLAVNVAAAWGAPVQLLDCDVEAPNARLFLPVRGGERVIATLPVPEVDESLCDSCGECGRFCRYHAIVALGAPPLLFPELCHGCGGCARVCPRQAIRERPRRIGEITTWTAGHITLIEGRLDVGVPAAPPLIRAVQARARDDGFVLVDAPPGTSCPVITALHGADRVLLVTEPTPFGLHDLTLAVATVRALAIPFGVVVNRMGIGDDRVHTYCAVEGIPILLEIPDDRRIAEAYSRGELLIEAVPGLRGPLQALPGRVAELASCASPASPLDPVIRANPASPAAQSSKGEV